MPYLDPPVMLLDVDGVLNAHGPYPGATTKNRRLNALWGCRMDRGIASMNGRDWVMKWAQPLMAELVSLHEDGAAEVRWASTWNSHIDQLELLFGLPKWPIAFETTGLHWTEVAKRKRRAANDVREREGRRLIWVDDAEVPYHWELAHAAMTADGRSLLIRPREEIGLRPEDIEKIRLFCADPAADEEILHIQQIGSTLTICGGGDNGHGPGTWPSNSNCGDCVRIYKEATQ